MRFLIFFLRLLNVVFSISWYRNFGTSIDNPECMEETQPIVEYYTIDEYQYMFFSERVSWDEAQTICPIYDGQLAIVDTTEKAYKLAAAIAESNIDMEDIWIGGQRSNAGNWTWLNEEPIPLEPTDGFPPWVRTPNRPWKQCVGMDRYTVDVPLFVDLDCRLPKPFICQRNFDAPANPDVTLPSHMVTAGKSTYILYHSRISWGTAAAFCRMRGYRLAIIPNNKIAKIVATTMVRSRPSFENVWLSGHFIHKKWRWLSTGEGIQSYPNENNYPPWHYNSTNRTSGCILLDRHVCDNPVFLSVKCDRKRDFICEKYEKNIKHNVKPGPIKILYKNWTMIFVLKDLNWHDAQKYCHEQNAYLTEVYDYDMMKAITTIMSDQESEPVHVWLGGMFINGKWMWVESNTTIPMARDDGGFMEWCDIDEKGDNDCLNMDREAHDKPVVYGLKCKLKQPFVCTKRTTHWQQQSDATLSTTIKTTTKISTKTKTTRAHPTTTKTSPTPTTTKTSTTPSTTKTTATPTTTPPTTTKTTTTPTTTTPTTITTTTTPTTTKTTTTSTTTKTTTTPTTTTRTTTTRTTTTRTTTSLTTTPLPKFIECDQIPVVTEVRNDKVYVSFFTPSTFVGAETSCNEAGGKLARVMKKEKQVLSNNIVKNTIDCAVEHLWISTATINCTYIKYSTSTALRSTECVGDKGYICEIQCGNHMFKSPMFDNNIWNCSNEEMNTICNVSCKQGSVLEGTNRLLCSTVRWVDTYNRTTQLPICQSEEKVPTDLIDWIKEFHRRQYRMLYVVDEAITISTEQWWQQLQFIAGLIQVFPLSELFPFGMIVYHRNAKTVIPFNATDTCEVLELMHKLHPDPNAGTSVYQPALELAVKQIKTYQSDEKVAIVFFATTANAGEKNQETIKKLKGKHRIFTIAISEEPKDDLLPLASTMNEKLLSYTFYDFQSLAKVAFSFTNYRSKELECPERLYILPKDSLCHQDSISIYNGGVTYTAFFNKKTYADAQIKCNDAGGELASFKGGNLKVIVNNIMKEAKSCAALELWITSNQAPCASIEISHKREKSEELNCSLTHGEICEISCETYPKLPRYTNNIWNCTKPAGVHTCYVECKGDSVMRGSDTVICTKKGWIVNANKQITYFPICFDENTALEKLLTVTQDLIYETDGFLFLIDISGLASNSNWKPLQLIISMINVFPISSHYPLGLVIFHKKAEVLIPYKATDPCKVLKQIQELKLQTASDDNGYSSYNDALKEAQNQIFTFQPRRKTIIFFVTDRNSRGESYEKVVTELKQRHTMFGVGINKHSMKDLDSLASMYNDKLLMYKFNHHNSYNAVLKKMQNENSKLKC